MSEYADIDAVTEETLRARNTAKWNTFGDALPLWIAEPDFPLAAPIVAAVIEALHRGETGYPALHQRGLTDAFEAYSREHYGVTPVRVVVVPDVMKGFELALRAVTPPGAGVVVLTPSYTHTLVVPEQLGYHVERVPMVLRDGRWYPDLGAIEAAFDAGAHTLALIQPHNPTGRMLTPDELRALSRIVSTHGGRVISDEIFSPVTWTRHLSYAGATPEAARHTLTVTSAVKGWNIAGLRCALLAAHNDADAALLDGLDMWETLGASSLGMRATEAAYRAGEPDRVHTTTYLRENALWLERELAARLPELGWRAPDATFLAWLDLRPFGLGVDAADYLMANGLIVNNGAEGGDDGIGFVRLNFGTTRAILTRAVDVLERALRERRPRPQEPQPTRWTAP